MSQTVVVGSGFGAYVFKQPAAVPAVVEEVAKEVDVPSIDHIADPAPATPSLLIPTALLLVCNAVMIVLVVMSGQEYPDYQYAFALTIPVGTVPVMLAAHLVWHWGDKPLARKWWAEPAIHSLPNAVFVGGMWACNYVFLLTANPYTPGVVQVILNEMNPIVVVLYSIILHGRRYLPTQYAAVAVALAAGLVPLCKPATTDAATDLPRAVWYATYFLGTVPIAVANVRTEKILQDDRRNGNRISIPLYYAVMNMWSLVFCLALFWVPAAMSQHGQFWDLFTTGMRKLWHFREVGAAWTWLAIGFQWVANVCAAYIAKHNDATYATLLLAVAPGMAGAFMAIRPLFGKYYQELNWTDIVSFPIVIIAVLAYKARGIVAKEEEEGAALLHGEDDGGLDGDEA